MSEVDWSKADRFFRARMRRLLGARDSADLEDLIQEALVRLLRATREEEARNLEALMSTIAQRTVWDSVRRRRRWDLIMRPLGEGDVAAVASTFAAPPIGGPFTLDPSGDPISRLEFMVLELFERHDIGCRDLARAFFRERDWATVARELNASHQAIRARWSRCLVRLRKAVALDPELREEMERARGDGS